MPKTSFRKNSDSPLGCSGLLPRVLILSFTVKPVMVVAKWHVRRTSGAPKALAVALSFCYLLGLGCPKQAFFALHGWQRGMFARESLQHFTTAEKDALYSIMNREDLNWRKLNPSLKLAAP
jgi:hypothetical protein